jgi:hypothetical protein
MQALSASVNGLNSLEAALKHLFGGRVALGVWPTQAWFWHEWDFETQIKYKIVSRARTPFPAFSLRKRALMLSEHVEKRAAPTTRRSLFRLETRV